MSDISDCFETFSLYENNKDLISYIHKLQIRPLLKTQLIQLVENDNYNDYMQIYNICLENDIELPPL
jgi:hypothetical protein